MAGTLFIAGNKRSGTSQLARLLTSHPQIFVSHESDAVWILYQFHNHHPFASHPKDSPRGMKYTLEKCGHVLDENKGIAENYFALQHCLMLTGSPWCPATNKSGLMWIGDKKPFQHTDPELVKFILDNFPTPHFIHLIRHPFAVAASAAAFNKTPDGDFWQRLTMDEIVERWTLHEKRVLELKQDKRVNVLDIRYEDLCRETAKELKTILHFLHLDMDEGMVKKAGRKTRYTIKNMPKIPCSEETRLIMEKYGYKPDGLEKNLLELSVTNIYWRLRKVF
jgi:hypothetical protein